ncbi:hypothetical protein EVAR_92185_1 [Eumeta japonica]|uniref:Uncharacterized protein n=1 Tax=Eumeta variegata TaxID=151549 RepID=A0A4C2ABI3_EUMVA|nr:hypothetical protein EVAR_92185_1 [Eumeta japonica]
MHSTRTRHEVRPAWARAPCVRRDTPLHHITRACVRPRQGQGRHVAGRGPGRKRPPAPSAPPTVPTPVLPSRRHPLVWSRFVKCSVCTAKTSIPLLERVVDIQMKCTLNPQNVHAPRILRVGDGHSEAPDFLIIECRKEPMRRELLYIQALKHKHSMSSDFVFALVTTVTEVINRLQTDCVNIAGQALQSRIKRLWVDY